MGAPKLHLVKGCGSNGWHSIIPLTQSQKRKQRSENTAVAIQDDANKQTGDAMWPGICQSVYKDILTQLVEGSP